MVLNGGRLVGGGGRSRSQRMKRWIERVVKWYREEGGGGVRVTTRQ